MPYGRSNRGKPSARANWSASDGRPLNLVYIGTAAFAVPTLRALHGAGHPVRLVVTQPDRPAGRGLRLTPPPVKQAAGELGLPIFQPDRIKEPDSVERIGALSPDLLVVVAYGQILPESLLRLPRMGALNLHASLLPRHRGPAPIAWAILSDDRETGVTVMQMDAGVDTGPIIAQRRLRIDPRETAPGLERRLAQEGAELMVETVAAIAAGIAHPDPQPADGATHARRLRPEDGRLHLGMTAAEIDRRVRALTPDPGCWLMLPAGPVKVLAGHVEAAGERVKGVPLQTSEGIYIIDELQPPGGRPMSAEAYLRGRR